MKARSVRRVRPPSKSRFSPAAEPFASAFNSSCGSSPLAPASKGPERLTSTSPPSSPSAVALSDISSSPLLTPSRLAFSRPAFGSSPLLSSPPPQAASRPVRAARVANRARIRKRLKRWDSSCDRRTGPGGSLGRGRRILPRAAHPGLDFRDHEAHHLDPGKALRLRRDHPPAGVRQGGPLQHLLPRLGVLGQLLAVAPVLVGQLPRFERVLGAGFEALQLLVGRDLQPELDDDRPLVGEAGLEPVDLLVGAAPLLATGEAP